MKIDLSALYFKKSIATGSFGANEILKLDYTADRSKLGRLPAHVLGHDHHLVDDGVDLKVVQIAVLVGVVQPEHD